MKKDLLALSLLVLPSCTLDPYADLPYRSKDRLEVNLENKVRNVCYKTEKAGVEDLQELLRTSAYEEGFVFLPKKNLWIEAGCDEEIDLILVPRANNSTSALATVNGASLRVPHDFFNQIFKEHDSVVFYHIHPSLATIEQLLQNKEFQKPFIDSKRVPYDRVYCTASSNDSNDILPSPTDINTLRYYLNIFTTHNPQGSHIHKIASQYGITTFSFTKEGLTKFNSRPREFLKYLEDYPHRIHSIGPLIPADLAKAMSDSYLTIEFEPYTSKDQ